MSLDTDFTLDNCAGGLYASLFDSIIGLDTYSLQGGSLCIIVGWHN